MGKQTPFYGDLMAFHPEATGSGILISVRYPDDTRTKFLVDFGLFQETQYESLNRKLLFKPDEISFVLVTHNHIDHTGRLPFLVRKGYRGPIWLTEGTNLLIGEALQDNAKVLADETKYTKTKPIYDIGNVEDTLRLLRPVDFEETVQMDEHIKVTFFMNGHILGAAMILVQISYEGEEDINLFFTGDYNDQNMFFDVDELPSWVTELPINIVIESTYGDKTSDQVEKRFKEDSIDAINSRKIEVATVFSLGRAQEGLYETKKWQESGELSKEIPIYLAGKLAYTYTDILLNNPDVFRIKEEMRNFLPANFNYISGREIRDLLSDPKPKIIFTTSGMGTNGPATVFLPYYLQRSNALIYFMGYLAENSKGYKIKNTEYGKTVKMQGMLVPRIADVKFTEEFSAHAKGDVLLKLLNKFSNKRMVMINHGAMQKQMFFANKVFNETDARNVGIFGGNTVFRVNHWGYVKSFSAKF